MRLQPIINRFHSLRKPQGFVLAYLLAFLISEALTPFIPLVVMACHGLVVMALYFHAASMHSRWIRRILVALSLAPLFRIVFLMLPLERYPFYFWYLAAGIPLFIAAFLVTPGTFLRLREPGLQIPAKTLKVAFVLGGKGIGILDYLTLHPMTLASNISPNAFIHGLNRDYLSITGILILLTLVLLKELASVSGNVTSARQRKMLNVGIAPLFIAFVWVAVSRIMTLLK